jgi:sulfatase maturation enzyme AslB (radical SAM superfamily)
LGNVSRQTLGEVWNGPELKRLRTEMNDYKFGLGCDLCEWQIVNGNESYTSTFERFPVLSEQPEWPQMMGFALSNTCNFECIMCSGELSSLIRSKREGLPPLPKVYSDAFFQELRPFLQHLKQAMFYGGEPFLTPECYRLWDMMIEDGLTVPCHVTTNGSKYNEKVQRILDSLTMSLSISVDGATKETLESVRVNSNYEELMANLRLFREHTRRRGTYMNLSFCLMQQNWHEFADVLLIAEDLGCDVFINTVVTPEHCSLYKLPKDELSRIVDELERQTQRLDGKLKINRHIWEEQLQTLWNNAGGEKAGTLTQIITATTDAKPAEKSAKFSVSYGWDLVREGRLSEALAEAQKPDPKHPQYYHSLVLRAHVRRLMADLDQAEAHLEEAIRVSRNPREALYERAWLRAAQNRLEEGIVDAQKSAELCKGKKEELRLAQSNALLLCGRLRRLQGDIAAAGADLDAAVQLSANPQEALMERAWLRFQQNRFDEGIRDAEQGREIDGQKPEVLRLLAQLYTGAGRFRDAEAVNERLAELDGSKLAATV